jgi:hypothetical protein
VTILLHSRAILSVPGESKRGGSGCCAHKLSIQAKETTNLRLQLGVSFLLLAFCSRLKELKESRYVIEGFNKQLSQV